MRPCYWLGLFLVLVAAGELQGQARQPDHGPTTVALWGAGPLPLDFAPMPGPLRRTTDPDSTRRRPFFLPRPGEHTAYWVGFGAGLALSPFLWCDGSGCGAVSKASTSLALACAGAVSGLLLSRTF